MLLGTLETSLLGNKLAIKGIIRAEKELPDLVMSLKNLHLKKAFESNRHINKL